MSTRITRLQLPFLGARTYLQGTTIFDGLQLLVPAGASLTVKFPHLLFTDTLLVCEVEDGPAPANVVLKWKHGHERGSLFAYPGEPSAAPQREPYDEDSLVQLAEFGPDFVRLDAESPFSFCASIVALMKALLHRVLPAPAPGRWLFVRLDLAQVPQRFLPLELRLLPLSTTTLARSDVRIGGQSVGVLYFSWLESS